MSGVQRNIAVLSHNNALKQQSSLGTGSYLRQEDEPPVQASGYCVDVNADASSVLSASLFPGLPTPLQLPSPDNSQVQAFVDPETDEKYWFCANQSHLSLLDSSHRIIAFFLPIVELQELDVRGCSEQIRETVAYLRRQSVSSLGITALSVCDNLISIGIQEILFVFSVHSVKIPDRMKHAEAVPTLSCCKGFITATAPPKVLPSVQSIFQFMEGKSQSTSVYNTADIHSTLALKVLELKAATVVRPPLHFKSIMGPIVSLLSFPVAVSAQDRLDVDGGVIGTASVVIAVTPIALVAYLMGKQQLICQWTSPSLLAPLTAYVSDSDDKDDDGMNNDRKKDYPLSVSTELSPGGTWASFVVQESNVLLLHALPHKFIYSYQRSYTAVLASCASMLSFCGPVLSVSFSTRSNIFENTILVLLLSGQIRIFNTCPAKLRFGSPRVGDTHSSSSALPLYSFPLLVIGKEDFLTSAAIHQHLTTVSQSRQDQSVSYNVPWNQALELRASKTTQDTTKVLQASTMSGIASLYSSEAPVAKYLYATPLATADTSLPSNSIAASLCNEFLDYVSPADAHNYTLAVAHLFDPEPQPAINQAKQRYVSAAFVEPQRARERSILTWHEATKLLDTHVSAFPHSMEAVLRKFLAQNGHNQEPSARKVKAIARVIKLITLPLQHVYRVGTLHGHYSYTVLSPLDIPTVTTTCAPGTYVSKHTSMLLRNTSELSVSQLLSDAIGHPVTKDSAISDSINVPFSTIYSKLLIDCESSSFFATCDTFGSCSMHEVRELDPMRSQASSNSLFHLNQSPALSVPGKLYAIQAMDDTLVLTLHSTEGSLLKYIIHHDHSSRGMIDGLLHASVGGLCMRGRRLLLPRTRVSSAISSPYIFILSRLANLIPVILNNSLIEYPTSSTSHESASLLLRVLPTQITLYNNSSSCSTDRPGNLSLHSKILPVFIEQELTRRYILTELFHVISADPRDYRDCTSTDFIHQICKYTRNGGEIPTCNLKDMDPVKSAILYSLAKSIVSVHSIPTYKHAMLAPSSSSGTITIHVTGYLLYSEEHASTLCKADSEMVVEEEEECARHLHPALHPKQQEFTPPTIHLQRSRLRSLRAATVVDTYILHAGALRNQSLGEHKWMLTNRVVLPAVKAELWLDDQSVPTSDFHQCSSLHELLAMTQPQAFLVYRGNLSPLDRAATPSPETFNHAKRVTYGDFGDSSEIPEPINTWNAAVVSYSSVAAVVSLSALHDDKNMECGYQAWPVQITKENALELYPWCRTLRRYSAVGNVTKSVKLADQEPLHKLHHSGLVRVDIINPEAATLCEGTPLHVHMLAPVESVDEAICQSSGVLVGYVTPGNLIQLAEVPIIGLPYIDPEVPVMQMAVEQPEVFVSTLLRPQGSRVLSLQLVSTFQLCVVYTSGECVVFSGPNGLFNEEMRLDQAGLLRKQFSVAPDFPISPALLTAWPRPLELGDGVVRLAVPSADPGFLDVYSPNPEKHTLNSTCWGNDQLNHLSTWTVIAHARVCSYGLSIAAACIINPVFIAITITPSRDTANGISVLTPSPSAIKLIPFNSIFEHVHRHLRNEDLLQNHSLPSLPPYHPTSLLSDLKASHLQKYANTLVHLHYAVCTSRGQNLKSRVHAALYHGENIPQELENASTTTSDSINSMNLYLPSLALTNSVVGNILLPDIDDLKQTFRLEMILEKEQAEKKRMEAIQQQQQQKLHQKQVKSQPAFKSMLDDSDSDDNTVHAFADPRIAAMPKVKSMLDDSDTDEDSKPVVSVDPRASPAVKSMLDSDSDSDQGFFDPRAQPAKPAAAPPVKSALNNDSDSDDGFGITDFRSPGPYAAPPPGPRSMLDSDSDSDNNSSGFIDPRSAKPAPTPAKPAAKPKSMLDSDSDDDDIPATRSVVAEPISLPIWSEFYPLNAHIQIEDKAKLTTKALPVTAYVPILKLTRTHIWELVLLLSGYSLPSLPVDYLSLCSSGTPVVDAALQSAIEECLANESPVYTLLPFFSKAVQKELIAVLLSNLHAVDTPVATFDPATLKPVNTAASAFVPSGLVSAPNAPIPGVGLGGVLEGVGYAHTYKTEEKSAAHEALEHLNIVKPFLNDSTPDVFAAKYMAAAAQEAVEFLFRTNAELRLKALNPETKHIDIDYSGMKLQMWAVSNLVCSRTPYVGLHHALCHVSMVSQYIQHTFLDTHRAKSPLIKFLTAPFDPLLYSIPDNSASPQPSITDTPSPVDANMLKWQAMRAMGLGYSLCSPDVTPSYASMQLTRVMKAQYTRSRSANDCLLWAMITNQKAEFLNLMKNEPNMSKAYQFFTNNFALPQWNEKACANAFNSISKGKFYVASAFFILAGKYEEAVRLLVRNENDIQLALVISKIIGSRGQGITYLEPNDPCLCSDDKIIGIDTHGVIPARNIHLQQNGPMSNTVLEAHPGKIPICLFEKVIRQEIIPNAQNNPWLMFLAFYMMGDVERALLVLITHTPRSLAGCRLFLDMVSSSSVSYRQLQNISECLLRHMGMTYKSPVQRHTPSNDGLNMITQVLQLVCFWQAFAAKRIGVTTLTLDCMAVHDSAGLLAQQYFRAWRELNFMADMDDWEPVWRSTVGVGGVQYCHAQNRHDRLNILSRADLVTRSSMSTLLTEVLFKQASANPKTVIASFVRKDQQTNAELSPSTLALVQKLQFQKDPLSNEALLHLGLHNAHWNADCLRICNEFGSAVHLTAPTLTKGLFARLSIDSLILLHTSIQSSLSLTATLAEQTYLYLCGRRAPSNRFCPSTSFTSFTNTFVPIANLGVHQLSSFLTQELESLATLLRSNNLQNLLGEPELWYSPRCISTVCKSVFPIVLRQYNSQTTHYFLASALAQSIALLNPEAKCKSCGDIGLLFSRQAIALIKDSSFQPAIPDKLDAHYFNPPNHPLNNSVSSLSFVQAFSYSWSKLRATSANPLCSFLLQPVHPSVRPVALLMFMAAEISSFLTAASSENYAALSSLLLNATPLPDANAPDVVDALAKAHSMTEVMNFLQSNPTIPTAPIPAILQETITLDGSHSKKQLVNTLLVDNIRIPALRQILTKPNTESLALEAQSLAKLFFVHALVRSFVAKFEALYGKDGFLSPKKWFSSSLIAADTQPPADLFNIPCPSCKTQARLVKTTFAAIATTPTLVAMRDNTFRLVHFVLKSMHYMQSNFATLIKTKLTRLVSKATQEKRMFQLPLSSMLRSQYYNSSANTSSNDTGSGSSKIASSTSSTELENLDDSIAFLMANLNASAAHPILPISKSPVVSVGSEYPVINFEMGTIGTQTLLTLLKPLPGGNNCLVDATPANAHLISTISVSNTLIGQNYINQPSYLDNLMDDDESAQYRPFPMYSVLEPLVLAAVTNPAAVTLQSSMKVLPQLMELMQAIILTAEGRAYELPLLSYLRSIPTPSCFQDIPGLPQNGFTNGIPTPLESRLGFISPLESFYVSKKKYMQEALSLLSAVSSALVRALARKKPTHNNPGLLSLPESALLNAVAAVLQLLPTSPSVDIVGPVHVLAPGDKLRTQASAVSDDFIVLATNKGPVELSLRALLLATEFHSLAEDNSIPHRSTLSLNEPVIPVKNLNVYPNHLGNLQLDIVHPSNGQPLYSPVSEFRTALVQSPPSVLPQLQGIFSQALGKPLFSCAIFNSVTVNNPMVPIVMQFPSPSTSLTTQVLENIAGREASLSTEQSSAQGIQVVLPSAPDVESVLSTCLTTAPLRLTVQPQVSLTSPPTVKPVKTAPAVVTTTGTVYSGGACLNLLLPYLAGKINHPLYRNIVQRAFESLISSAPSIDHSAAVPWISCLQLAQSLRALPTTRIVAHPSQPLYVTVAEDNLLLLWHRHCPMPLANLAVNLRNTALDVAFGFSTNMALTSTTLSSHNPHYSYAYSSTPGNPIRYTQSYQTFDIKADTVESVCFDPTASYLCVMYSSGVVGVWKLDTNNTQYNMIVTQPNVTANRWTIKAIPALHIFRAHNLRGRQACFLSPFVLATAGKSSNGANVAIWDLLKPNTKRCVAAYNLFNGETVADLSLQYNPKKEHFFTRVKHNPVLATTENTLSQAFQYDPRVTTAETIFSNEAEAAYQSKHTPGASSLCFVPELDLLVVGGPGPLYVLNAHTFLLVQALDPKTSCKLQVIDSVIQAVAESVALSLCDLSQHKQSRTFQSYHDVTPLKDHGSSRSIAVSSIYQSTLDPPSLIDSSPASPVTSAPNSPRAEAAIMTDVESIVYSASMQSLILGTNEEDVIIMDTAVIPLPLLPPATSHSAEFHTTVQEDEITVKRKIETRVQTTTTLKTNLLCAFGKGFVTSLVYKKDLKNKKKEKHPDKMHISVGTQKDGDLITVVYPDCAVIAQKHKVPTI